MALIRNLECDLTDDELQVKHGELLRVLTEVETAEAEFSDVKAEWKGRLGELDSSRKRLQKELQRKKETRPVECREVHDDRRGQVTIIRCDTETQIESRPMTVEERQGDLPLEDEDFGDAATEPPAEPPPEPGKKGRRKKGEAAAEV